ncbi:aldo/keto reductase [Swaminathania salitolerans]|uniref:Oxidoreductase n=1 Tax=Swaminathania salitolerans TaxID=182838 RepID=A0A511BV29_9PROT|nr:aldo/keto reductase [Swaminathania salitolerans]GBQ13131.1 2,5-diketo-D-gluconate reductase [Swaminathania salitolerans LMG 21291]GEL03344.1 oxidoreductase [Swaminathania salitolerans]
MSRDNFSPDLASATPLANEEYLHLALNDGTRIPQLGLGVYKTPADETAEIVRHAAKTGYRMVDTASFYGNESGVGDALQDYPDLYAVTKLWATDMGRDATLRAFDESAKKLRHDPVDLYLIHWPMPKKDLYVETWKTLISLREEGRVTSIGVCNFEPEHLTRLIEETGVAPVLNQIELHPSFQQKELRAFNEAHDIRTEAWSPLGRGAGLDNEIVAGIARKHGKSAGQVVIRWHLDLGNIVIPKSANPKRIDENFDVFDFSLDEDDMAKIATLDRADGRTGPDPMTADF